MDACSPLLSPGTRSVKLSWPSPTRSAAWHSPARTSAVPKTETGADELQAEVEAKLKDLTLCADGFASVRARRRQRDAPVISELQAALKSLTAAEASKRDLTRALVGEQEKRCRSELIAHEMALREAEVLSMQRLLRETVMQHLDASSARLSLLRSDHVDTVHCLRSCSEELSESFADVCRHRDRLREQVEEKTAALASVEAMVGVSIGERQEAVAERDAAVETANEAEQRTAAALSALAAAEERGSSAEQAAAAAHANVQELERALAATREASGTTERRLSSDVTKLRQQHAAEMDDLRQQHRGQLRESERRCIEEGNARVHRMEADHARQLEEANSKHAAAAAQAAQVKRRLAAEEDASAAARDERAALAAQVSDLERALRERDRQMLDLQEENGEAVRRMAAHHQWELAEVNASADKRIEGERRAAVSERMDAAEAAEAKARVLADEHAAALRDLGSAHRDQVLEMSARAAGLTRELAAAREQYRVAAASWAEEMAAVVQAGEDSVHSERRSADEREGRLRVELSAVSAALRAAEQTRIELASEHAAESRRAEAAAQQELLDARRGAAAAEDSLRGELDAVRARAERAEEAAEARLREVGRLTELARGRDDARAALAAEAEERAAGLEEERRRAEAALLEAEAAARSARAALAERDAEAAAAQRAHEAALAGAKSHHADECEAIRSAAAAELTACRAEESRAAERAQRRERELLEEVSKVRALAAAERDETMAQLRDTELRCAAAAQMELDKLRATEEASRAQVELVRRQLADDLRAAEQRLLDERARSQKIEEEAQSRLEGVRREREEEVRKERELAANKLGRATAEGDEVVAGLQGQLREVERRTAEQLSAMQQDRAELQRCLDSHEEEHRAAERRLVAEHAEDLHRRSAEAAKQLSEAQHVAKMAAEAAEHTRQSQAAEQSRKHERELADLRRKIELLSTELSEARCAREREAADNVAARAQLSERHKRDMVHAQQLHEQETRKRDSERQSAEEVLRRECDALAEQTEAERKKVESADGRARAAHAQLRSVQTSQEEAEAALRESECERCSAEEEACRYVVSLSQCSELLRLSFLMSGLTAKQASAESEEAASARRIEHERELAAAERAQRDRLLQAGRERRAEEERLRGELARAAEAHADAASSARSELERETDGRVRVEQALRDSASALLGNCGELESALRRAVCSDERSARLVIALGGARRTGEEAVKERECRLEELVQELDGERVAHQRTQRKADEAAWSLREAREQAEAAERRAQRQDEVRRAELASEHRRELREVATRADQQDCRACGLQEACERRGVGMEWAVKLYELAVCARADQRIAADNAARHATECLSELQSERDSLYRRQNQAASDASEQQRTITDLTRDLDQATSDRIKLQDSLTASAEEVANLAARLRAAEAEVENVRGAANAAEAAASDARGRAAELERSVASLQDEAEEAASALRAAQQRAEDFAAEASAAQGRAEAAQKAADDASDLSKSLRSKLDSLQDMAEKDVQRQRAHTLSSFKDDLVVPSVWVPGTSTLRMDKAIVDDYLQRFDDIAAAGSKQKPQVRKTLAKELQEHWTAVKLKRNELYSKWLADTEEERVALLKDRKRWEKLNRELVEHYGSTRGAFSRINVDRLSVTQMRGESGKERSWGFERVPLEAQQEVTFEELRRGLKVRPFAASQLEPMTKVLDFLGLGSIQQRDFVALLEGRLTIEDIHARQERLLECSVEECRSPVSPASATSSFRVKSPAATIHALQFTRRLRTGAAASASGPPRPDAAA